MTCGRIANKIHVTKPDYANVMIRRLSQTHTHLACYANVMIRRLGQTHTHLACYVNVMIRRLEQTHTHLACYVNTNNKPRGLYHSVKVVAARCRLTARSCLVNRCYTHTRAHTHTHKHTHTHTHTHTHSHTHTGGSNRLKQLSVVALSGSPFHTLQLTPLELLEQLIKVYSMQSCFGPRYWLGRALAC